MSWEDELKIVGAKEELIRKITEIVGVEPPGLRVLLRTLGHPDLVGDVLRYLQPLDEALRCQMYATPWNCAREAEARYQNIKYGWLGGAGGIGYDETWCEPCRKKVLGGE